MMKQGKKQLKIFGICLAFALLLLSIFFVSGLSITNFYGQSNSTNTTFHNNSNQTFLIQLNRYANVTEAFLNITGLRQYDNHLFFNSIIDTTDTNLKAWYNLNGNFEDSSIYSNDGTNSGSTSTTTHAFGSAYDFDGTNDCILTDNSDSLNISGNITLSAWINLDNYVNYRRIVAKSHTVSSEPYTMYGLLLDTNSSTGLFGDSKKAVRMELASNGSQHFVRTTTSLEENTWYLITGTYNQGNGEAKIYVNGILDNSTLYRTFDFSPFNATVVNNLTLGAIDTNSNPLSIGSSGFNRVCSDFIDGKIDEVLIYDKVLTATEIYNLYKYNSITDTQNYTHTAAGNKTYYLEIPRYSNVTESYFNLSGLTSAWDLSTAIYNNHIGAHVNARALTFKPDGTKMFVSGNSYLFAYNLTTAWNISTAVPHWSGSIYPVEEGLSFSPDGTKMFGSHYTDKRAYQYSMSTPWDVSTLTQDAGSLGLVGNTWNIFMSPDGTRFYESPSSTVYEYTLSDPFNLSSATLNGNNLTKNGDYGGTGITFSPNGKYLFEADRWGDKIHKYVLATPWDISTAVYTATTLTTGGTDLCGVALSPDGTKIFSIESGDIWQYDLVSYPNNLTLYLSNQTIWTHTGEFNLTNNKTNDLSSSINLILNGGACNYPSASLDGDNCLIPLIISSDSIGKINFGNLNITTSYPSNLWLEVGTPDETREWNYTGEYSTTTKTNNLSAQMNSALNDGACNCTGCSLDGQYCSVPFIFHSDQGGKITTENVIMTYLTTYEINTNAISYVNILELDEAVVYGKNATSYLADSVTYHEFAINDDTQTNYLMISYAELNAILTIYVNGYEVGTISAVAGGTGAWKSAVFDVTSSQLLTSNTITVSADASNSDTAYINEMYFVESDRRESIYLKNGTAIAVLTDISGTPDYMALNISYDNTTNVLQEDLDLRAYHNTTEGKIINIFKTEQYDGNVTLTPLANQTDKATILTSNNWTIIVDKNIPIFNTITTSLSNLLAGRTYAMTLNQTETNPSYINFNLNDVAQGNLTQNITNTELWYGNITYVDGYTNNISITSYDLAGNSYTYSFSTNVSKATTTETNPDYNTSMSKTNYFNTSSSDINYSITLKKILTTVTEGYAYINNLELNTTITDTYPISIYALLDNSTINFTDNDTEPNWTTDAFNNTETNTLSFTNDLVYKINNSVIVKYGDVGVQNERLFWVKTENLSSEINNTWFKFPVRTAYDRTAYIVQMKVCSAGHTYGGSTCSSWSIVSSTLYSQTNSDYNGGIYPTVDDDGDGNIDYIYFKVPSINSSDVILYSFDTIVGAESDWSDNLGGGGGGSSRGDDETPEEDGLIDKLIDKTGAVGQFFKTIGGVIDDYFFRPIGYMITSITTRWSDTVGFFVVSTLVLISGVILFLSGGKKKKTWYAGGFQT